MNLSFENFFYGHFCPYVSNLCLSEGVIFVRDAKKTWYDTIFFVKLFIIENFNFFNQRDGLVYSKSILFP